jgi:hypothetical protein
LIYFEQQGGVLLWAGFLLVKIFRIYGFVIAELIKQSLVFVGLMIVDLQRFRQ